MDFAESPGCGVGRCSIAPFGRGFISKIEDGEEKLELGRRQLGHRRIAGRVVGVVQVEHRTGPRKRASSEEDVRKRTLVNCGNLSCSSPSSSSVAARHRGEQGVNNVQSGIDNQNPSLVATFHSAMTGQQSWGPSRTATTGAIPVSDDQFWL